MHYVMNNPIAESHRQIFLSYKAIVGSWMNAFSRATMSPMGPRLSSERWGWWQMVMVCKGPARRVAFNCRTFPRQSSPPCACRGRWLVFAPSLNSVIGFSSLTSMGTRFTSAFMVAVRGAPSGALVFLLTGLLTRVQLPPAFSSVGGSSFTQ